jgi:hypothetical protein
VDNDELLSVIRNTISDGVPEPEQPAQVEPVVMQPVTLPSERGSIFGKLTAFFSPEKAKD